MSGLEFANHFILAWSSCGITSAVAGKIEQERNSCTKFYYIDIDSAHHDNDRFISDLEKWYETKIIRIRSTKYKDQFDVIEKIRYINGPTGAACTKKLKKDVRFELEKNLKPDLFDQDKMQYKNQVHGFEWDLNEIGRALDYATDYPYTNPIFPLIEKKLTKNNCAQILINAGIEIPEMYKLGYNNNNCIGCVKGGMGYWNKIRIDFPDVFNKMKKLERQIGHSCIKGVFLDELDPARGRTPKPIIPNCSIVCEDIAPPELNMNRAKKVYSGEISIQDAVKEIKNRVLKY